MVEPHVTAFVISLFATVVGMAYIAAGISLKFLTKDDTHKTNHPALTFCFLGASILLLTHLPASETQPWATDLVRFTLIFAIAWIGYDYYQRVMSHRDYRDVRDGLNEFLK